MSLPQDNEEFYEAELVYEASLVEHESQKRRGPSAGCIVGMILGGGFSLLLLGLVGWVILTSGSFLGPVATIDAQVDMSEAVEFTQGVGSTPVAAERDVSQHPDFKKIDRFVSQLAACLDDTANRHVRKLVDHRQYWKELCKRSDNYFYEGNLTRTDVQALADQIIGPAPFSNKDYEILLIEKMADGYRIALSYDIGFGHEELQIWWLSENNKRILLYDWFEFETGMRESRTDAATYDATRAQIVGYNRYAENVNKYFEIDEELEYDDYQREIKASLKASEHYQGPPSLTNANHLVTAKRWAYHDEPVEAVRLLNRISKPGRTPGVFLLRGDIHFQNGLFEEAQKEYQRFVSAAVSYPYVEKQLIECARELGDFAGEKKLLQEFCKFVNAQKAVQLSELVGLNSETENQELFRKIDALDKGDRKAIFSRITSTLQFSANRNQILQQVRSHLDQTAPDSFLARAAGVTSEATDESLIEIVEWLDGREGEEFSQESYEFWSQIADDRIPAILTKSKKKEKHFLAISEYYSYDGYLPDNAEEIGNLVLADNPKSPAVNAWMASHFIEKKKWKAAIEKLKIAMNSVDTDDENDHSNRYLMLRALFGKGDSRAAFAWAREHEMESSLLSFEISAEDDAKAEELLELLDKGSDDHRFYSARLKVVRGQTEAAVKELASLAKASDEKSLANSRYYYQLRAVLADAGQLIRLVEFFPVEQRFWEVANVMLADRDWDACQQLLDIEKAEFADAQRCLKLLLHWNQGDYKTLAKLEVSSAEAPQKRSNRDRILDSLVRSCVQEGLFGKAKQWAQQHTHSSSKINAFAGIAIKQGKWEEAAKRLSQMSYYHRDALAKDSYLWDQQAFDQPEIARLIPPASNASVESGMVQLSFLFTSDHPPIEEQKFATLFQKVLGDQVEETEFAPAPDGTRWKSLSTESFNVTLKVTNPDYKESEKNSRSGSYPDDEEIQQLGQLFAKAHTRIDLGIRPNRPLSSAESMKLVDSFAMPVCSLKPILLGRNNYWLTADKFDGYFSAKTKKENLLSASKECCGIWGYPPTDLDEEKLEPSESIGFHENLVAVLNRFAASTDPSRELVVRTDSGELAINVDRIKRNRWGGLSVVGKPEPLENVPDMVVPRRSFSASLASIVQFDAKFDGESIQKEDPRRSNDQ